MKKVIFETVGNMIMFILLGLAFTQFSVAKEEGAVVFGANQFMVIFLVFMVLYGGAIFIINKKQGGTTRHLLIGLQLHKDTDERDKHITEVASKTTYLVMMFVMGLATSVPIVMRAFEEMSLVEIDYFKVSVWSPLITIMIMNLSFAVKWCMEYRK